MSGLEEAAFRESEIRPDHLMGGQAEAAAADADWLMQHNGSFVIVPCPACGSQTESEAFRKSGLSYKVCLCCGTMYINPRPGPELLEEYYARSEGYRYWNDYIFPASEGARRDKIFRPRARRIADICHRNNIDNGVLLEVGAGFGTFCEEVLRLGTFRRVIAVEPVPDLAETCRRKGLEVIEEPIEQVRLGQGTVDVIASFEVIEHLFSPRDFFRKCADILLPGGLLVVTCPSARGFDVVVLQGLTSTVGAEHLNYFHPASLSHLVGECGFETLEAITPGKLDAELVRKAILLGDLDVSSQPFLEQILVGEWERVGGSFQRFLSDNLLSSHMWLVARKIDYC